MGACPAGSSPCGFGTVARLPSTVTPILRKPDGTQGDCRAIDTRTGDYVLDASGNAVGWDSLDQKVYLALRTDLGSSAEQSLGVQWPTGVIRDDMAARNKAAVVAALKRLTEAGEIVLLDVITTRIGPTRMSREVRWRATGSNRSRSTFV